MASKVPAIKTLLKQYTASQLQCLSRRAETAHLMKYLDYSLKEVKSYLKDRDRETINRSSCGVLGYYE